MVDKDTEKPIPWLEQWRPILTWTFEDVVAIHHKHGLRPCPLYLRNATRVGCWPCIMSNKDELAMLAKDDRRVRAMRMIESLVGDLARARREARGETIEGWNPPAFFQANKPDKNKKHPSISIDTVLEWACTEWGGRCR